MQVELLKKTGTYTNKDGEEKTATNFYLRCGDVLVPIQVRYFEDEQTGRDPNYSGRKLVLSSFASPLPEQPAKKKAESTKIDPVAKTEFEQAAVGDGDLPF